ncbi:MAG TPA: hypothetical protein VHZ56_08820 [Devosia sp.]|nr:hypothetical protein [Devosia sp.]
MADIARVIAIGGAIGALVAGSLVAPAFLPAVMASEPTALGSTAAKLFPPPFDPKSLRKFDIVLDEQVSTDVKRTQTVSKIGYGEKSTVTIITTPSGTYSSDALGSPYVQYPGFDKAPGDVHRHWAYSTFTTPYGTGSWSSFSSGSFTYFDYHFTPAPRHGAWRTGVASGQAVLNL